MDAEKNFKIGRSELIMDFFGDEPEDIPERMLEFNELMMKYNAVIREVTTKLEVLNDELSQSRQHNPIETISSRIKKPLSIAQKLQRRGEPVSIESISRCLNDVAGIRVVCPFIDDIYDIAGMLTRQDDVTVIECKDYIKNPKPNGYRSLHLILEVPVFFSHYKQPMRVEVQIRTVAMDFWASLEHQIRYKNDSPETRKIADELKECADVIAQTDRKMQNLRDRVQAKAGR